MKGRKIFLFKGINILGAVMLFASIVLPGWQVYATDAFSPITVADITNEALASETYNFTSYAEQAATTEYATGAVKVINKGTIVNVTENYKVDDESGFVGKEYYVKATNNTAGTKYPLWSSLNAVSDEGISVEILDGDNENGYNFVSYAGDTKRGNGKVSVVETGAVVKVINNYKLDDTNDFVGKSFYVDKTNCTVNGEICTVYTSVEGEGSPVQAGFFVRITETLGDGYSFISYADVAGETKWGDGIVTVDEFNNEKYEKVTVTKNYRLDDSFVGNEYVVTGANNGFYELYGLDGNDGGIAVTIGDPVLCGESKTCYDFVSYDPDNTDVKWGDGKVEFEYEYTKVMVDENYALDSSFNQNFVVYATEYGMYELYTTEAAPTGIWVEISSGDKENGYDFVSYSDEQKSTKRGNGKVEFVNGFTTVEVTENSIEGFAGNKFVVYATELSASDTVYPLYTTGGDVAGIYVKIEAIPQTTPSSSSNYSGGGGGGSSKSSASSSNESKTDEKATNTAKADEQKADEAKADSKDGEVLGTVANEVAVPMTEAQAVAKFGQEQIDAYKWAHDKGITTMDTVEDARLDEPLTRAELAKMMVVYMVKIANKSPVVTGTVSYPDVKSEELGDLAGYIQLAYQFQIMGIDANGKPIDEFNPNGLVTRGEYATVFSRVLFGSLFNQEGEDFYSKHIAALNAAGILTNTDPTIQEMRGWVMLMMYRSSQNLEEIAKVAAEIGATDEEVEAGKKAAEILAEEEAKAETTTGDVAEAPIAEEQAQATTGDVVEAPAAKEQAEAATGDVAEVPAVEETASAEANTGEVAAEPSNN